MTRSFLRQSRDSDVLVIRQKSRLVLDLHTTAQCTVKCSCTPECDIRKNFDTNEYPNIFVSKNLHE